MCLLFLFLWAVPPGNISTPGWSCVFFSHIWSFRFLLYLLHTNSEGLPYSLVRTGFFDQIASRAVNYIDTFLTSSVIYC